MTRLGRRVIRIPQCPRHLAFRSVERGLGSADTFALLVKDRRLLNSERDWLDCRLHALAKLQVEQSREEPFTRNVSSERQRIRTRIGGILRTGSESCTTGAKLKIRNVYLAQHRSRKLGFEMKFFARLEMSWRAGFLGQCGWSPDRYRKEKQGDDGVFLMNSQGLILKVQSLNQEQSPGDDQPERCSIFPVTQVKRPVEPDGGRIALPVRR